MFTKAIVALALTAIATLSLQSQGATRYKVDEITSEEGGPVSFPSGFTGNTTGVGTVYSDSAALTLTAGTNVAAVVTPVTLEFFRVGKQVCAYGQVSIDPTAGATATVFTLSLPVVPTANFSGTSKLSGHAGILGGAVGSCLATTAAKTATCNYISGGTPVELVPVSFCYSATGA